MLSTEHKKLTEVPFRLNHNFIKELVAEDHERYIVFQLRGYDSVAMINAEYQFSIIFEVDRAEQGYQLSYIAVAGIAARYGLTLEVPF